MKKRKAGSVEGRGWYPGRRSREGKKERNRAFACEVFPLWFFGLLALWSPGVCPSAIAAESPLQVVRIDGDRLILRFELPQLQLGQQETGGQTFTRISFEGAMPTMEVGRPSLPVYAQLLGIPANAAPYAQIINSESEIRSTQRIIPASDGTIAMDTDFYRRNGFHPAQPIEIVPIGFIREQRVARLQIQPIQYNPATSQIRIHHELLIQIDFNAPASPLAAPPLFIPTSEPFEQLFRAKLLNYSQAKAWREYPQRQSPLSPAAPAQEATDERYKIPVDRTDIYKITYNDLRQAGADVGNVRLETVRMENRGRTIGVHVFDQNEDGRFDTDDAIIFYGQALVGNKFTDDNVYWLSWGGADRSQVESRDAAPKTPNAPIPSAFKQTERFEEDREHDRLLEVRSELADHYFWTRLTGGAGERFSRKVFPITTPRAVTREVIGRNAEIRVKLQGASTKGIHKARILLNEKQLGRVEEWQKQAAPLIVREIEQRQVIFPEETNFLTINAEDQNGTPPSEPDFYVDWFEIDYWHIFEALGGKLEFNSETDPPTTGTVHYRITNLHSPNIDVYKLHNGSITAKLVNGRMEERRTFELTFEDTVTERSSYFVVDTNRYSRVRRISRAKPSILRNPANQADYIIISHSDFIDSIQPLAEFRRRTQNLSTMVVDVEEIYDQFSHGIFNPLAIQKFLRYAYTSWRSPKPTYVLLVGDAHYDYKGAIVRLYQIEFSKGYDLYPIYVPTFHGWSINSGEAAMDHRFVAISGDDALPDMFIGRLSVQFPRELDTMVRKIIDYEDKRENGPWQGRLMQIADNDVNNPTDDIFERSREELIETRIPVGFDTRKVYLRQIVSPQRTNQAILQTIEEGVLALEYSGHGGTQTWADESIFRIEDAQRLRNKRLPFVITTTCLNGQFDQPLQFGQRSLSEQFMMGNSGAIATLSATRLTLGTANAEFDKDLFRSMFSVKPSTLGAIIADAKTQFIMRSSKLWVSDAEQYTLFGDPATRLALPDLEIQVELEEIAVDPNKEIVILPNVVGSHRFSPSTGSIEFRKATDFSTETMSALALFANDLDNDPTNDRPSKQNRIRVWQGDFGVIRLSIPRDAAPGLGVVRLFAFDGQQAAVGGAKFWTYQPVILDIREDMDHQVTNTLNLSVRVIDNEGPAGIRSIEASWDNTVDFKKNTTVMVRDPAPPSSEAGGTWYKLQTPIPLPKGGRSVRYRIIVTDNTNQVVTSDRQTVKVPEGANIAIASTASRTAPIRYAFSKERDAYTLTTELVNKGGRDVDVDIEVWFSEGNPDANGDHQIDESAEILGRAVVRVDEWQPGETELQQVTVTTTLDQPLSTGFHKIYAFADPESLDDDHEDGIIGKLDERLSFDNKNFYTFVVNEFTLKTSEELTAFSLDRVFDAFFPVGAAEENAVTLAVNTIEPPVSFQPDVRFGPLPRIAALRKGTPESDLFRSAYQIELHSEIEELAKPVDFKLRFDLDILKDNVREKFGLVPGVEGFDAALQREADTLAIYAWQEQLRAWKRLPSEVARDASGNFALEKFITPTQAENTSTQTLRVSQIRVDPNLTPVGKWIILFLDADRYEILFQRKGKSEIEKLTQAGQVGQTFRDEVIGIELDIPRGETDPSGKPLAFEFGDVLTFETELGPDGAVRLSAVRNTNRGNGTAHVSLYTESNQFETGDWLIFAEDSERYEMRNALNEPVRHTNGVPVKGTVNQPLILRNMGIEILVTAGGQPYEFGDKIKFSTTTVGVVSTQTKTLPQIALMANADREAPKLHLWVNGEQPQTSSVIPPRPEISLLLEDENGIDLDSFALAVSKDDGPFETIEDFSIGSSDTVTTVPILYKPILFIGRYIFRIWLRDLNGLELGGKGGFGEFVFFVEEQPDLDPPTIDIRINDELLIDDAILREQPHIEIDIHDDHGILPETVQVAFSSAIMPLVPLPPESYDLEFDPAEATFAQISFAPDLPNDEYQIQVTATDTSENISDAPLYRFRVEEPVDITDVLNAPNPVRVNTAFTYNLAQTPDQVTIKIYTVSGRLIRTIEDASARRNYNETYWDARDANGERLANGTYFYRIIVEADEHKIEKVGRLAILR